MNDIKVYRAYWLNETGDKVYLNKGKLYLKRSHCKNGAHCHFYQFAPIGKKTEIYIEECDLTVSGINQIGVCDRTSRWGYTIDWRDNA